MRSVLVAAIDVTYYAQLFLQAKLPKGSALALTDQTGTRIYRYPYPAEYQGRPDLDHMMRSMSEGGVEGTFIAKGGGRRTASVRLQTPAAADEKRSALHPRRYPRTRGACRGEFPGPAQPYPPRRGGGAGDAVRVRTGHVDHCAAPGAACGGVAKTRQGRPLVSHGNAAQPG